jgi:hypothetical protein
VDERLLAEVDQVREPFGLDLSRIVEEALKHWLKRYESDMKAINQKIIFALDLIEAD